MDTYGESELLEWCAVVLGGVEVLADDSREHPGDRTGARRLRTDSGICYLKIHNDPIHWHNEVHGYRAWAAAFGPNAPRLLAVRDEAPLALVVTALPGQILDEVQLAVVQQQNVWRQAGAALADLHNSATGSFFGPCQPDGTPAGAVITDAQTFLSAELDGWQRRGMAIACLTPDEIGIVAAARGLLPAFAGERPVPCHRDYGPANWLVTEDGVWSGVIDFEFSQWDVRMADFTRYPNWEWVDRPDLIEAFCAGYGRDFTPAEESQRLVCHILYALAAVVWGEESAYHGFAAEGRRALALLVLTVDRRPQTADGDSRYLKRSLNGTTNQRRSAVSRPRSALPPKRRFPYENWTQLRHLSGRLGPVPKGGGHGPGRRGRA